MIGIWYKKFGVLLLTLVTVFFFYPNLYTAGAGIFTPTSPNYPPQVIMTGTFVPAKGAVKPGLNTFTVTIENHQRTLVVKNIRTLTTDAFGPELLNEIFPAQLTFWGNKTLLTKLAKPQIEGKLVRLQGTLYVTDGIFHVTSGHVVS